MPRKNSTNGPRSFALTAHERPLQRPDFTICVSFGRLLGHGRLGSDSSDGSDWSDSSDSGSDSDGSDTDASGRTDWSDPVQFGWFGQTLENLECLFGEQGPTLQNLERLFGELPFLRFDF